jgi:hypothetical protein
MKERKTGQPNAEPDAASPPPADSVGADEIDEINEPWAYLAAMRRLDRQRRTAYLEHWFDLVAERPLLEQHALVTAGKEVWGYPVEPVRRLLKDRVRHRETAPQVAPSVQADEWAAEMFHRPEGEPATGYLVYDYASGEIREAPSVKVDTVEVYPPRATPLLARLVRLPSGHEDYDSPSALFAAVRRCLQRYIAFADETDAIVCTAYVFLTWLYDKFGALPYLKFTGDILKFTGDIGTGKTRALEVVGNLTYRSVFAGGAATASPLFRIIERFGGSLVIDEADFGDSEMEAVIIKILAMGYRRGFPVLRTERTEEGFDVRGYEVFGPKLLTGRRDFRDGGALASRCVHVTMVASTSLEGKPMQLPLDFAAEAQRLRNQLCLWRFRTWPTLPFDPWATVTGVSEGRVVEIGLPLLAVALDDEIRGTLVGALQAASAALEAERGVSWEGLILSALQEVMAFNDWRYGGGPANVPVKDLLPHLRQDLPTANTTTVARIIRRQLRLRTGSTGGYPTVIVTGEDGRVNRGRLERLAKRYGVARPADGEPKPGV